MGEKKTIPVVPILVCTAALLYACYHLIHIITPFILSAALAYMLNPVFTHLESRGLRRDPVVLFLYLAVLGLLALAATRVVPILLNEWDDLQAAAPTYIQQSEKFLNALPKKVASQVPAASKLVEKWVKDLYAPAIEQIQHLPGYLLGLFPVLSLFILVPFITFFLLVDGNKSIAGVIQACPSRYVEQVLYLMSEIDTSLGRYLRGIIVESIVVGFLALIGLFAIGLDHAVAVAFLAAVTALIPYIGAVITGSVAAAMALYQFGDFWAPLKVLALFAGVRFVDDWFIQPMISKHSVQLHPLIFLLALMISGHLFGALGLALAVPAAAVIKSLMKVAWDWYSTEALRDDVEHLDVGVAPYT
jgi:predicted PurR-regulated permease PerM